ncbi:ABC transporter ATP-binding protein [Embleya sp. NBC_00896]|uniref:ABC transporter ATP-binding protein n=1 Tax=Embleya sp. NBC_00896 TaxID=2975961 RepID=UPI003866949D|nr:ABC transporter ATP-binding protein [Embleya sp. NBC_00896]
MEPGALFVQGLEVVYGRSVRALRGISLDVPANGVVAVLGANGAGKSTLLRAVSGTLSLHRGAITAGSIEYGGERLGGRDPAVIVRAGVVQVPEGRRVFANLSVDENLQAGALSMRGLRRGKRVSTATRTSRDRVFDLFPVLAERREQRAGLLSGGEQQMLAIGRALMASPRLLLLDEPSLGLAPRMVGRIAGVVREIAAQGVAVLLVEQNATVALDLADKAYVLDVGEVRLAGSSADLARTDEVRRLYLGEAEAARPDAAAGAPPGRDPRPAPRKPLRRWEG